MGYTNNDRSFNLSKTQPPAGEDATPPAAPVQGDALGPLPELNMSNYNEDDVSALNEWGVQAAARIEALVAERDALVREQGDWYDKLQVADAHAEAAERELAEAHRDAERYRYLRADAEGIEFRDKSDNSWRADCPAGDDLDAAIDIARGSAT